MNSTTERLATGKKVASAVDNPTNYFAALNYEERADGLSSRLDGMGEAMQTINAADNGITTLKGFLSQMKGVVNDALGETDSNARADLGKQYNELINQAQQMVEDASYGGINLLHNDSGTADTLTVEFDEKIGESTLDVEGFNIATATSANNYTAGRFAAAAATAGDGSKAAFMMDADGSVYGIKSYGTSSVAATGFEVNWAGTDYKTTLGGSSGVVKSIEDMEEALTTQASKLANNLAVITQREDFTNEHINILQEGADNLTLADMNEEGANLLSLQTSQTLGIQSLSLASQQNQAVLQIIG